MRLALRGFLAGSVVVCAATGAQASPPVSSELMLPLSGGISTYANTDDKTGGSIPSVGRGQMLGVACAKVDRASDVRVVLALAPNEAPTGYTGVLATDQTITKNAVHIRVPDVPDLAQHTVKIRVYVTDSKGIRTCEAGRVKVV